ncbi:sce7726 family protein [Acinetobacter bereziniae]|uniref:sce7726 family protein n=1 Tax=Acinetobacter bereziniae TaxID=106648 RepID=UPI003AF9231A
MCNNFELSANITSKAFSRSILTDLAKRNESEKLKQIIKQLDVFESKKTLTYGDLYTNLYHQLVGSYRNEYVYKNALASKIVAGRHKYKDISYFTEFRAWDVIADVVIANGTTTVYEIKTEYDSFFRLESQLETYQQIFDNVCVVIPESKLSALEKTISENVGIIILTDNYTLSTYRSPSSNIDNLNHEKIFSCLRKSEYEDILNRNLGYIDNTKSAYRKREALNQFLLLDKKIIHNEFLNSLKARQFDAKTKDIIKSMPSCLNSLNMTMKFNLEEFKNLEKVMNSYI